MSKIINFNSKDKKRRDINSELEEEVQQYVDDIVELAEEKEYGGKIQEKISGIVVILDFDNRETTTQLWITDDKLD